jgi:hypothetical protein
MLILRRRRRRSRLKAKVWSGNLFKVEENGTDWPS